MTRQRIRKNGRYAYVDTDAGDAHTNPLYSCEVLGKPGDEVRLVATWMAFDPKYGPESDKQIEWHVAHGTPGAETWEVGVPL